MRADNFALGTPTQSGYVLPYSEPFSFIGYNSLINSTRTAHSTVRDMATTSSAGVSPREINSPFEAPASSINRGKIDGRIPLLPNVPPDDASLRGRQFLPSVSSTFAPRREMPFSQNNEPLSPRSSSATLQAV